MKRPNLAVVLGVAGLTLASVHAQQPQAAAPSAVPGEIIVRFSPAAALSRRDAILASRAARLIRKYDALGVEHVRLRPGENIATAMAQLRAMPDVVAVQPNFIRRVIAPAPPNDPFWVAGLLWGLEKIQAGATWNGFTTGDPSIVIADIDTGVEYTHPDLAPNMWHNPAEIAGNGVDDDNNGYVDDVFGIDVINANETPGGPEDPMDDHGHGTHVAGTLAGVGNNSTGVSGVTWNSKVLACKFIGSNGEGTDADAIACFDYIVALKLRGVNIRVSNNSWGSTDGPAPALQSAIDAAGAAGILNVFAAGNEGVDNDAVAHYPSGFSSPSILAVAASDESDARASFSNYGATSVDLAAPGNTIISTYLDSGYAISSGTSMAAPHVAGAAALLAAIDPSLSVAALKTLMMDSVDVLPAWQGSVVSGGRLNVYRAATILTGGIPAAAALVQTDSTTKGNWSLGYGLDGGAIVSDSTSYPSYAQVSTTGAATYTWAGSTPDVRALRRGSGSGRVAAAWYANSFEIAINLTDGAPHDVAFYALDWDSTTRAQRFDVYDGVGGQLLASYNASGFHDGQYVIWRLTGSVRVKVTKTAGANAVVSGVFFGGPAATNQPPTIAFTAPAAGAGFTAPASITVSADAADDVAVAQVQFFANTVPIGTDSTSPYSISWTNVPAGSYTLTATVTDNQGLTENAAPIQITVAAGGGGPVAQFLRTDPTTQGNWMGAYGADGYSIINDSASLPPYAQVTPSGNLNFTWAASTTDVRALQRASGPGRLAATWYGNAFDITLNLTDGQAHDVALYSLDWDTFARAQRLDVFDATSGALLATQSISGYHNGVYTVWRLSGKVRIRSTKTAGNNAVIGGIFFGGASASNQAPNVTITSPANNATFTAPATVTINVNATDDGTIANVEFFANGAPIGSDASSPYSFIWTNVPAGSFALTARATDTLGLSTTSAPVQISVAAPGGPTAAYLRTDTTTKGTWLPDVYGEDGYNVINDSTSYPSFAQVSPAGQSTYTWTSSTADVRALQRASGTGRLAAAWYSNTSFEITMNLTDGLAHEVAFYVVDWDSSSRAQRFDVYDAVAGTLLATQSVNSFNGGKYIVFRLSGNVRVRVTKTAGNNAVVSGFFFDRP
ncbi:MAG TPA: S8 family serine peptidase [Vicinamibacterales bacterium]